MHLLQGQRDPKPSGAPGEKHIAKQRCPDTLQKCSDRDTSCLHAPQQHSVLGDGFIPPPAFTSGEAFAGIGGEEETTAGRDLQRTDPQRQSNCNALELYRNVNSDPFSIPTKDFRNILRGCSVSE